MSNHENRLKMCQFMGEQAVKMEIERETLEPERGER